MKVIAYFDTYTEVEEFLQEAFEVYMLIEQEYRETIALTTNKSNQIVYKVILLLYESK